MLRRTTPRMWLVASKDDKNAPGTVFQNVKPSPLMRLFRQIRHRAWIMLSWDEEFVSLNAEGYLAKTRMEQCVFTPTGLYGSVPGSYTDPTLYMNKNSSPFRWGAYRHNDEKNGSWMMDIDEIQRLKDWNPKDPNDPLELWPKIPNFELDWEETVDEHGNRCLKNKFKYGVHDPHGATERYPFAHHYSGEVREQKELYGFKQGQFLRCNEEEEEVLRRVMYEEDREWEMIKGTEIIQEPWMYPGKIRSGDMDGSIDRAKARWKKQRQEGKPTDPSKDPDYDYAMSSEFVEPRDGEGAEWRHLWLSEREGGPHAEFHGRTTMNKGYRFEDNENNPNDYVAPKPQRDDKGHHH
eukprot:PhF_6_TR26558/c0_g1_i1/m.38424